ncbi:unnamed protein product, partial [Polarella glacialis]
MALLWILVGLALPWSALAANDCARRMGSVRTACPVLGTGDSQDARVLSAHVCEDAMCNKFLIEANSTCGEESGGIYISQLLSICSPCFRGFMGLQSSCNFTAAAPTYEEVCGVDTYCHQSLKTIQTSCSPTETVAGIIVYDRVQDLLQMCDSGRCSFAANAVSADHRCIADDGPNLEAACTTACNPLFCTAVQHCEGQVELPAFMNMPSTMISVFRRKLIKALEPCACGSDRKLNPSPEKTTSKHPKSPTAGTNSSAPSSAGQCQASEKSCSRNIYDGTGVSMGTDIVCVQMGVNCPCDEDFEDQCFYGVADGVMYPSGDHSYGSSGPPSGDPSYGSAGYPPGDPSYGSSGYPSGDHSYGSSGSPSGDPSYGSSGYPSGDAFYGSSGSYSGDPSYGNATYPSGDPSYGSSGYPSGDPSYGSSGSLPGDPSYGNATDPSGDPYYGSSGYPSGDPSYGSSGSPSGDPSYGSSGYPSGNASYGSSGYPSGDPSYGSSGYPSGDPSYVSSGSLPGDPSYGNATDPSGDPYYGSSGYPSGDPSYGSSGSPSGDPSYGNAPYPSGDPSYGSSGYPSGDPSYGSSGSPSGDPSYGNAAYPSGDPSYGSSGHPSGDPSYGSSYGSLPGDPSYGNATDPSGDPSYGSPGYPSGDPSYGSSGSPSGDPSYGSSGYPSGDPSYGSSGSPPGDPSYGNATDPSGDPSYGSPGYPSGDPSYGSSGSPSGDPSYGNAPYPSGDPSYGSSGYSSGDPSYGPTPASLPGDPSYSSTTLSSGDPSYGSSGYSSGDPSYGPTPAPLQGDPSYSSTTLSSGDPSYGSSGYSSGDPSYGPTPAPLQGDPSYSSTTLSSGDPSYGSSGYSSGDPSYGPTPAPFQDDPSYSSTTLSSGDPSYGSSGYPSGEPSYGSSGSPSDFPWRRMAYDDSKGSSGSPSGDPSYGSSGYPSGDPSYGSHGSPSGDPSYASASYASGDPSYGSSSDPSPDASYGGTSSDSYCQAKSVGGCSASSSGGSYPEMSGCLTGQMECYLTTYDAAGEPDYSSKSRPTCVNQSAGCPCNLDWEHKCEDSWGSWCQAQMMGSCPITCGVDQTICYAAPYDAEGNADYMASALGNQSCADISEGCSCNADWEVKCSGPYGSWCQETRWGKCPVMCAAGEILCFETVYDSSGNPNYKGESKETCADENAGCSCNSVWENKCTDSWGSWCMSTMYGDCPVTCNATQTMCYATVYDAGTGEADWMAPSTQTCADMTTGCPCNSDFENKCEEDGYSWCQSKKWQCPIKCQETETECFAMAYNSQTGYPDFDFAGNQSCAPLASGCPCNSQFEDSCTGWYGSYCQPKVWGSCPLSCSDDEYLCYETVYTDTGEPDWMSTKGNQSCASMTLGCPCNAQWEQKCSDSWGSWCESKLYSCPLHCGADPVCYSASGNMSCSTPSGCVCDAATELSCPDPYMPGKNQCLSQTWYSACPLTCQAGETLCSSVGFDGTGAPTWTDTCSVTSDWKCPVLCGSGATKCGQGDMSYCIPSSQSCPVECTETEKSCWVDSYDPQGQYASGEEQCVLLTQNCPCGSGAMNCTSYGKSYCLPATMTCPVVCDDATQKTCVVMSYTASGSWNDTATRMECAALSQSCSCGTNAKLCKFTDENGLSEDYCLPSSVDGNELTCPVTCKSDEQTCYQANYNSTGSHLGFLQTCAAASATCPCGTETLHCRAGTGDSYCMPNYDLELQQPMVCPVVCDYATEDLCTIPSFDSQGGLASVRDKCVPKGGTCDCKLGTNAQSCNMTTLFGEWTECIPRVGAYCPVKCASGEVSCPLLEDFLPNGTWKGSRQPSVTCAANSSACSCGLEAKQCVLQGGIVWCQPKSMQCPVTCSAAGQKKCYLTDYSGSGDAVDEKASCPCGKNAAKCPGTEICLTAVARTAVCPCAANEDFCWVKDYTSDGTAAGEFPKCTPKDTACQCGKNTIKCADPRDATQFACVPKSTKDGKGGSCPRPCTPAQEAAGNQTCIQTNLGPEGKFVSETVTCGVAGGCPTGSNMKKCPSGAVISTAEQCVDLYGLGNKNASATAVNASQVQKATLTFTLTGVAGSDNIGSKADNANVAVKSALQLPSTLKSTLSIMAVGGSSSAASRRLTAGSAIAVMEVQNQGASGVSPQQAADQLKRMVQSGDNKLSKAMSDIGSVDATAGVSVASVTRTVETRASAAAGVNAAQEAAQVANIMTTTVRTTTVRTTTSRPVQGTSQSPSVQGTTSQGPSVQGSSQGPLVSTTSAAPSTTPAPLQPTVLQGKMTITVPSCAAFVANSNATGSVKEGLAAAANTPVAYLDVTLACSARRLSQTRRLADETVNADYTITIPATDSSVVAAIVIAHLNGPVSASIAQTISQQTGISVTVSVTKPVVVEDSQNGHSASEAVDSKTMFASLAVVT